MNSLNKLCVVTLYLFGYTTSVTLEGDNSISAEANETQRNGLNSQDYSLTFKAKIIREVKLSIEASSDFNFYNKTNIGTRIQL